MDAVAAQQVEIGAIVRFEAPNSRNADGHPRVIPAVVIGQWPNGNLQLYALHFEGSFLVNAIPPNMVEMVLSRIEFDAISESWQRRLTELENQVASLVEQSTGQKPQPKPDLKYSMA